MTLNYRIRHGQGKRGAASAARISRACHIFADMRGDLVRVPFKTLPEGFDKADHGLYPVALSVWRGLVFVNLVQDVATSPADMPRRPGLAAPRQ